MQLRLVLFFAAVFLAVMSNMPEAGTASAKGFGLSEYELRFNRSLPERVKSFKVINLGESPSSYHVYVEDAYKQWFDISPQAFILSPDQFEEVTVTLRPPEDAGGDHVVMINVMEVAEDSGLNLGVAIRIVAHVSATLAASEALPPGQTGEGERETLIRFSLWIGLAVVLLAVMIAIIVWRWRRREKGIWRNCDRFP